MTVHEWDCRTGGAYSYTHRRGEDAYGFHGSFHDVRPGELIVQTFAFDGMPDAVALERLTFTDLGDGRTLLTLDLARRVVRGARPAHRQRHGAGHRAELRAARRAPRRLTVAAGDQAPTRALRWATRAAVRWSSSVAVARRCWLGGASRS